MKRRSILKQIGAATAITSVVGTATAHPAPTLDVSNVSGTVPLSVVLDRNDLAGYEGDLSEVYIEVGEEMDVFDPQSNHDCCSITCDKQWRQPNCPPICGCCECMMYG